MNVKTGVSSKMSIFALFVCLLVFISVQTFAGDNDLDGVDNSIDNCIDVYNPSQIESEPSLVPFMTLDIIDARTDAQGQNGAGKIYFKSTFSTGSLGYIHNDGRFIEPNGDQNNPPTLDYPLYMTMGAVTPMPAQMVTLDTSSGEMLIYLPFAYTSTTLYIADDGSTYYDEAMTQVARVSPTPSGSDGLGDECDNCPSVHNADQAESEPSTDHFGALDLTYAYTDAQGQNGINNIIVKSTFSSSVLGYIHNDGRYIEPNGDLNNPPNTDHLYYLTMGGNDPMPAQTITLETSSGDINVYVPAVDTSTYLYIADDGSTYYSLMNLVTLARIAPSPGGDGVGTACDNCPLTHNFDQMDYDQDGLGYPCDVPADLDLDRDVDLADFAILANYWLWEETVTGN